MTRQERAALAAADALLRYGHAWAAETLLAECPAEPARRALAALRAGDATEAAEIIAPALAGLGWASTGMEEGAHE